MKIFFILFFFFSLFLFPQSTLSPKETISPFLSPSVNPCEQYANKIIDSLETDLKFYKNDRYLGSYVRNIDWKIVRLQMHELLAYPHDTVFIIGQIHTPPSNTLRTPDVMNSIIRSQLYVESALSIAGKNIDIVVVEGFPYGILSREHIIEAKRDSFYLPENMNGILHVASPWSVGLYRFEKEKPYNAVYRLIDAPLHTYWGGEDSTVHHLVAIMNLMVDCFSKKGSQAQRYYADINESYGEKFRILRSLIMLSETLKHMHVSRKNTGMIVVGHYHIQDFLKLEQNMMIPNLTFQKINTREILTASQ